jgi:hypothetical protein
VTCEKNRKPPRATAPSTAERAYLERFYAQRLDRENASLAARVMLRRLEEVLDRFAPGSVVVPPPPHTPDEFLFAVSSRGAFYKSSPKCSSIAGPPRSTRTLFIGFNLGCDGLWRMTATPVNDAYVKPTPVNTTPEPHHHLPSRRARFFGFSA